MDESKNPYFHFSPMTWINLNVLIEIFKILNSANACYYNLIQNTFLVASYLKQTNISWYHTVRKTQFAGL